MREVDKKQINNKYIKKDNYNYEYNDKSNFKYNCCCYSGDYYFFNFNIIGPFFVILNLVGIYILIGLLKATQKEMIIGIKSFLFEKNLTNLNEAFNLQDNYKNYFFKNIPEFHLLFLTSFIGNLLLEGIGFSLSSIFFMVIILIIIFFFR